MLIEPFKARVTGHAVMTLDGAELPGNYWVLDFLEHLATGNTSYAWFNWGTSIELFDEAWSILMNSPQDVWLDENGDQLAGENELRGAFTLGAAREYGDGRIVVYGDNNVWDLYRDPNYAMYLAMIEWLAGD